MTHTKGILAHKRWISVLLIGLLLASALPALAAATEGTIRNPNGGTYVNLRLWAGYDAPVVCCLNVGTKVQILSAQGDWYSVSVNGTTGFIHSAFISFGAGIPSGKAATITVGPVNVHETPSTRGRVITQLTSGAGVTVLSYGDTWSQIQSGSLYGYVMSDYLQFGAVPVPPPANNPAPKVNTPGANATIRTNNGGNLNLREWANTSSKVIASYANGSRVRIFTHGATWCKVQAGEQVGYMLTKYLAFDGGKPTPGGNAVVNNPNSASRLNLRAEPSTGSKSLAQFHNGTLVKVLGVGTEWHRVNADGLNGYMMSKYVKLLDKKLTPHKTVTGGTNGFVNLREGAGYGYEVLRKVNNGSAATVVIPYSVWSKVIVKDGNGYLTGYMMNSFLK